jgi:hypothetical protein
MYADPTEHVHDCRRHHFVVWMFRCCPFAHFDLASDSFDPDNILDRHGHDPQAYHQRLQFHQPDRQQLL